MNRMAARVRARRAHARSRRELTRAMDNATYASMRNEFAWPAKPGESLASRQQK